MQVNRRSSTHRPEVKATVSPAHKQAKQAAAGGIPSGNNARHGAAQIAPAAVKAAAAGADNAVRRFGVVEGADHLGPIHELFDANGDVWKRP